MPSKSDHDDEVIDQQRYTAALSASIARASRRASKDLSDDVLRILDTYVAKGGFESRQEAQAYLKGYIEPKDRAVLIEAARRLPEPQRTQQLTRLSSAAYDWRMSRAQAVDKVQRLAATRLRADIEDTVKPVMDRTVRESAKRANYQMQKQIGMAYSFDLPNQRGTDEVVRGTGVYDKVVLFSQQEMKGVKEVITQGMLSGRKAETIAKEVQRQTGKQLYQARRLVRTTIAQASVDAKVKEYRELGIEEYEVVCTLDERTCPICSRYDGKRFKLGSGPMPTFHPNCRCGIRQVLPDAVRGSLKRAARDSGGNSIQVPYDMSYDQWNEKYGTPTKQRELDLREPASLGIYPNVDREEFMSLSRKEQESRYIETIEGMRQYAPRSRTRSSLSGPRPKESLHSDTWEKTLSDQEKQSLFGYTDELGFRINEMLYDTRGRAKKSSSESMLSDLDSIRICRNLDNAISRFNVDDETVVYRGLNKDLFEGRVGAPKVMDGYTSTSLFLNKAKNMADSSVRKNGGSPVIYEIMIPRGEGIGAYISAHSKYRRQREFLIHRGAMLEAISSREEDGYRIITLRFIE